jgi:hypothetical protein
VKTWKIVVRYLRFDNENKEPVEVTITAARMRCRKSNLEFLDDAGDVVAIFSFWEYAMEVQR